MGERIAHDTAARFPAERVTPTGVGLGPVAVLELAVILWRRRTLIALIAALTLGVAAFALSRIQPSFSATSEIMLTGRAALPTVRPDLREGWDDADVQGEIRVLQSSALLWPVAQNLALSLEPEFGEPERTGEVTGVLRLLRWTPPVRRADPDAAARKARLLAKLRARLVIKQRKLSRVLSISFRASRPDLAALIANALADAYISERLSRKAREAQRVSDWLTDQLRKMDADVAAAEARLAAETAERALTFGAVEDADARQLANLSETLRRVRADIARSAGGAPERRALLAREAALEASVARLRDTVAGQAESDIALRRLEQSVRSASALRDAFLDQLQEARAVSGVQTPDARVISSADPPAKPVFPNPTLILAFGVLAGLAMGGAAAVFLDSLRTPIRTRKALSGVLDAPVLSVFPEVGDIYAAARRKMHDSVRDGARALGAAMERQSPPIVAVVASAPGQGASAVSAVLARETAMRGGRSLLIDCDPADPAQAARFRLIGAADVHAVLTGAAALEEAVVRPDGAAFHVLPAQPGGPAGFEGAWRAPFAAMLARLRERFDLIVLDLPPFDDAADAVPLATLADGVIVCAHRDDACRQDVSELAAALRHAGAQIAGGVLTGAGRNYRKSRNHARFDRFQADFAD